MAGCGTATFADPDDFAMSVPGADVNLVLTKPGIFKARLTWARLPNLTLVRCQEVVPRVTFLRLKPGLVFVSFPTRFDPPLVWNGVEMRPGIIVLHGPGEHVCQRTSGDCGWGLVSLRPDVLTRYGRVLLHRELVAPPGAKFLKPPRQIAGELLRLHRQICRLVEAKAEMILHPEVVRAIDEDLLRALVLCLTGAEVHGDSDKRRRHLNTMVGFEMALASCQRAHRPMPELAAAAGVPEGTLRLRCAKFVGLSPVRYARMRRLQLVRAALRRADPAAASVKAIATQYGFLEPGRFAVQYRAVFGESPSTTLYDLRSKPGDVTFWEPCMS
jgi:AraC-like DNA-binding protein